jgi:prepilin-type N-terminal cleavage/methylation domain-containing protein
MRLTHPGQREAGVTLIEVLIVIVIMSVIIVPLTGAIITFLRSTDQTVDRMAESHDAQIASAYFAQDVQSIGVRDWTAAPYPVKQSIETGVAPTGGLYPCGTGTTPALVRFAWDDPAVGAPSVLRVSYVVQDVGSERQLHRVACTTATLPAAVKLTLTTRAPSNTSPYIVTLIAQRRQT